jgi:peptidoglycan/LPS O-acetylase OafA/YrhL
MGHYGIDLFFGLSSFLLTYLACIEIENTNNFSKKNFFIRRALRIYPLYFFVLVVSFLGIPLIGDLFNVNISLPEKKYLYFLFLSNYDNTDHIFALKFLWTISVEEQFYFMFMFLAPLFKRYVYIPILFLLISHLAGNYIGKVYHWNLYTATTTYFPHFAVGIIAGRLYFNSKVPSKKTLACIIVMSIILTALFFKFSFLNSVTRIPIAILIGGIILLTAQIFEGFDTGNTIMNATEYLGKYTYGLYVYSGFVIAFCVKFLDWDKPWYRFGLICVLLFPISFFSYKYFEVYFIKLKSRFRTEYEKKKRRP